MDRSVTPHEIVSVLEYISLDAHDRGRIERMSLMQLDRTADGRLSGNRSVIALQGNHHRVQPTVVAKAHLRKMEGQGAIFATEDHSR